jgi:plastocyanin
VTSLQARSGATVNVHFQNNDPGVAHDLSFAIDGVPRGNSCVGPCSDDYSFAAPTAGTYSFFCSVHPDMKGIFTVLP